jgi:hypothetical protein
MARPRLSDQEKRRRGTFEATRSEASLVHGRVALTEPLPPPSDIDADAQRMWRVLMVQCVASKTICSSNLAAFQAMVETAAARAKAYTLAMEQGPVQSTEAGTAKTSSAWTAFLATDQAYFRWAMTFGLTPKGGSQLPQLPVAGSVALRAVK